MGQMSRMARAARFIEEFNEAFKTQCDLKPGTTLYVKDVGLGENFEDVVMVVTLVEDDGTEHYLTLDDAVFDPDQDKGDTVARLKDVLGFTEEEIIAKLKNAELLG
jgi:hypothetical protein